MNEQRKRALELADMLGMEFVSDGAVDAAMLFLRALAAQPEQEPVDSEVGPVDLTHETPDPLRHQAQDAAQPFIKGGMPDADVWEAHAKRAAQPAGDELFRALQSAKWCVEYMASGMTHAQWATDYARNVKEQIDATLAQRGQGGE